jgi:asparagine synthase (glutamine-hydrolysing)
MMSGTSVGTSFVVHHPLNPTCACMVGDRHYSPVAFDQVGEPLVVHLAGELHAQRALVEALGTSVAANAASSDAALLAAAWRRWGEDAPNHVHGDYAAIVVEQRRRRITMLRDHIGSVPIVWHSDGRCVRVATSMTLLLPTLPGRPAPDEGRITDYLLDPNRSDSRTFLSDVQMVEAGHLVVVEPGRSRVVRWWRPEELPPLQGDDRGTFREHVGDLVVQAVADRLPADGQVGVHLSGGLDSTLVTLVAAELLTENGRRLGPAYSWSPPLSEVDPDLGASDERHRLARLAAESDLELRLSARGAGDLLALLRRPIEMEGTADVFDELSTLAAAQRDGVAVLLSGWGGDEVLSAHAPSMPAHLLRQGRPRAAAGAVRTLNGGISPLSGMLRGAWRHLVLPALPGPLYRRAPFFADIYRGGCYLGPALRVPGTHRSSVSRLTTDPKADLLRVLRHGHVGERMATWRTWAAPHGIVHRYPLTDRRLMERVLRAPTSFMWADGRPRYPARAAIGARTSSLISKADPANQQQRRRALADAWRALGDDVRIDALDGACDWVDLPTLRADLLRGPSGQLMPDVLTFARMMPALRVLDLWRRNT